MASAGSGKTSKIPTACKYYLSGACSKGSDCDFLHDRKAKADNVCRYFLAGSCTYGQRCRYDHIRNKKESPPTKASPKEKDAGAVEAKAQEAAAKTTVTKDKTAASAAASPLFHSKLRPEAAEFVPAASSSSSSTKQSAAPSTYASALSGQEPRKTTPKDKICPYNAEGQCFVGEEQCPFTHGQACDLCGALVMHPGRPELNREHRAACLAAHEADMEAAFAEQASADKVCGICMDVVMEKREPGERRFGILTNCRHCYCLRCIRQWRGQGRSEDADPRQGWDKRFVRQCPECRVSSEFVVPSGVWVDAQEQKTALIEAYREHLHSIPCKYHKASWGKKNSECLFGNKCFYRHLNPDGSLVEGDDPKDIQKRLRARREGGAGAMSLLADFLTLRLGEMDAFWDSVLEEEEADSASETEGDFFQRMYEDYQLTPREIFGGGSEDGMSFEDLIHHMAAVDAINDDDYYF